jgi:hypothetical protein
VFQLGFVDLFCRDTQPADIRQVLSPNEGLVAYGASHGRSGSIAKRWVISSPVAATQLSMNAGDRSQPQIAS